MRHLNLNHKDNPQFNYLLKKITMVLLFVNSFYPPPTLPTFAIELFIIVRMVTIVKTAVTASVTRAGGVSRGSTKPTHDKMTTITDGAYT